MKHIFCHSNADDIDKDEEELALHRDFTSVADSAEYLTLKDILALAEHHHEPVFAEYKGLLSPLQYPSLELTWARKKGDILYASGRYKDAIEKYKLALRIVVGEEHEFLSLSFVNEGYIEVMKTHDHSNLLFDLVACCNSTAQAYLDLGDKPKALDWLHEIETIYFCYRLKISRVDAGAMASSFLEFYTHRMKAAIMLSQIYLSLGNIAASSFFVHMCKEMHPLHSPKGIPEIEELKKESRSEELLKFRSPDLKIINDWDVSDPNLQIRGIWKKIHTRSPLGPRKRDYSISWIWRSRLYIFSGNVANRKTGELIQRMFDLWYLDLKTERWHRLPDFPINSSKSVDGVSKAIVYKDHAWFFSGHLQIMRFNLLRNKWGIISTSTRMTRWPYRDDKPFVMDQA